jgi:nitrate/nitrite-specific signal transduction histidine kinase
MPKLTSKIALPIILAGVFAIAIFIAIDYERLSPGFYVILALFAVYVFCFGFATGHTLASPVKKLLDRATELSKGNLSSRVYLETKDELAELAKVFNQIAEELQQSHAKEENTEKSVDIKVRARTQALEETINALDQKIKNRTIELERLITKSGALEKQAKEKETESLELKQELNNLKSRVGKYSKPKKKEVNSEANNIENA